MPSRNSTFEDSLVDLHGRVAIVTGGNTGVGYGTVQLLVHKGAKVYLAARNEQRALDAIQELRKEFETTDSQPGSGGSVEWLQLDLSSPRLAKKSAEEFLRKETRLDILVNNAAMGALGPYTVDEDGLLDPMATNHIGHFVFTDTLLPLMKTTSQEEGSDVRIVNLTSPVHAIVEVDSFAGKATLTKEYGSSLNGRLHTYAYSKLANILHIKELQRRLDSENIVITCIAVHPGAVRTDGASGFIASVPYIGKLFLAIAGPLFFSSWSKGAHNSVFAAASMEVRTNRDMYRGAYLTPVGRVARPSKSALDERLASELCDTTEQVLKDLGI
ncbi:hypothetical protein GALMADRAFT_277971 [Galerina marginata CBS 339.88]|uniref:Uncharacterized protein n=1 Tax=Galerina marginata (strain CBS 339.88) TaxID=685588 RepID=A0A067TFA2_GALM3|nr:hypothetical protein GALMADRAFT_277971 [Galerina marginata CBS 339.88]